jgi:SET domain-containing protein
MAMINDSHNSQYTNNCEIRINNYNIEIWSIRNIEKGEELFMSYGNEYWN